VAETGVQPQSGMVLGMLAASSPLQNAGHCRLLHVSHAHLVRGGALYSIVDVPRLCTEQYPPKKLRHLKISVQYFGNC
jgi:hypothetical protein